VLFFLTINLATSINQDVLSLVKKEKFGQAASASVCVAYSAFHITTKNSLAVSGTFNNVSTFQ
jgi:hypothetical protein